MQWRVSRDTEGHSAEAGETRIYAVPAALEQNGMTGVWEAPDETVARQARKMLSSQLIANIRVRVVAP
ncbi:hypothetical protein CW362_17035 [Streptomyces populi]|uniref:Uncharacterized protein n=1 Tax=Streptomyces populi TaxID=2058924 RepID=A0A2I0SPD7_9ACTN|nr:hypothetical protein CW362_17035 [Streptomyces populi]